MQHRKYIIYANPFDSSIGGVVALYALCKRLSDLGEEAVIWPSKKPASPFPWRSSIRDYLRYAKYYRKFVRGMRQIGCRTARWSDLRTGIVVYPEIIAGNPLGSSRIARWFLHRPGYHRGTIDYGPGEIYFFYQDAFNDDRINPDPSNRLTVTYLNPAYKDRNTGPRSGTCVLLRKGAARAPKIDEAECPIVDGLSHEQMAEVFNRCEYLISYDPYTMYSVFAAICGCVPVIIPEEGVSRDEWFPNPEDRLGLAYGWDEVPHARATRTALLERLAARSADEDEMIARFIEKTQRAFPLDPAGR